MKTAIVDIGANTVNMCIYEVFGQGKFNICDFFSDAAGLIGYVENSRLKEEGILRLAASLSMHKKSSVTAGADSFYAFATASLRNLENKEEVIVYIKNTLSIDIDIISDVDEANFSFLGLKSEIANLSSKGLMIDMGGGSTEFVSFENNKTKGCVSLPFGCLKLKLNFKPREIGSFVLGEISGYPFIKEFGHTLYLVGGTAKAMKKMAFAMYSENNLSPEIIFRMKDDFENNREKAYAILENTEPKRVNTFESGLFAYAAIVEYALTENISVVTAGVREGYLLGKVFK